MTLFEIAGIAIALSMDAFAVAIAAGSRLPRLSFRPVFRLSFHFGLFQFLMPIIGWAIGYQIAAIIQNFDHWVAFGLLAAIGLKMIYEAFSRDPDQSELHDLTRKWSMVGLSVATSIDALAVGLSVALLQLDILFAAIVIGITASLFTIGGMVCGRQLSRRFGRTMEILGGLILLSIGLKILVEL
jgi:putative Mn2+ efflux pump MntP